MREGIGGLLVMALAVTVLTVNVARAEEGIPSERRAELRHLVKHDCGSCHGLRLKGGLGPSLTPSALEGKPRELLERTILDGRDGTAMPPWRPFMSEAEARWIAEHLKQGAFIED